MANVRLALLNLEIVNIFYFSWFFVSFTQETDICLSSGAISVQTEEPILLKIPKKSQNIYVEEQYQIIYL